jgi:uncharacterized protein (TIGR01777 family)
MPVTDHRQAMARIVIPGGTGYVGSALAPRLVAAGHDVVVLTRGHPDTVDGVRRVHWDGRTTGPWVQELDGAAAVVHLAGRRVDCRPTRSNVDELIASRVDSVRVVGEALRALAVPPPTWVQLATLAIHGEGGDELITEQTVPSGLGPRQMVTVALAWERAVDWASAPCRRSVLLRAGIAIGGEDDPATQRLAQLVGLGLGGAVAGGQQWVSWLAEGDLLRIVERALDEQVAMDGLYNATAPTPVTNAQMMATYRDALGVRVGLPAPAIATRVGAWLLGSDPALALTGRRAVPHRLLDEGFRFQTTDLAEAVETALAG